MSGEWAYNAVTIIIIIIIIITIIIIIIIITTVFIHAFRRASMRLQDKNIKTIDKEKCLTTNNNG